MVGKSIYRVGVFFALFLLSLSSVLAAYSHIVPTGPDSYISRSNTTRVEVPPEDVLAQAGNVTELDFGVTAKTQSWQGYFGNVTGTITLDDASNNTLFDWSVANPEGEIYASNESVGDWDDINCVNLTDGDAGDVDETALAGLYGQDLALDDYDAVGNTFNETYSDATGFYAGNILINNADSCPLVHTYVDDAWQSTSFSEVLLTTASGDEVIYTALLEDNVDGFKANGDNHDFQMLVGENGHNGDSTATTYYFYLEIV